MNTKIKTVPYSAINRFEPHFIDHWTNRVNTLIKNTEFIGGEWIKKLEYRLATETNTKEARLCANGTDAIQLALRALGIGQGDIVLMPDLTFWATFEAICNVGGRPVTIDVDPHDFHLTEDVLQEAIKQFSPKAIILVHLYGWAAKDTIKIRTLCENKGIPLIEDSAQAWGVTLNKQPLMSDAYISTTSFYPGKVLGGAGDGGAIFTNDKKIAETIQLLANHGRQSKYEHHAVGWNSRLDVIQCTYLDLSLDYISERIASRQFAIDWYKKNIQNNKITWKQPHSSIQENGYISVTLLENTLRTKLIKQLDDAKIGYGIVYPLPISKQPGAYPWLYGSLDFHSSTKICHSILNLPCFAGIQLDELEYVKFHVEQGLL